MMAAGNSHQSGVGSVIRSELNNIRKKLHCLRHEHLKHMAAICAAMRDLAKAVEAAVSGGHARAMDAGITALAACPPSKAAATGSYEFSPIGWVESCHGSKNGSPRQPGVSPESFGVIRLLPTAFNNPQYAIQGLEQFSHIWIIFAFHLHSDKFVKAKVAPPRLHGKRVGVLCTRSPHRPNPIGLTLATLETVDGCSIHVSGLDLVSGTPVLDLKPYIPGYDNPSEMGLCERLGEDSGEAVQIRVPSWVQQTTTLTVAFTQRAVRDLERFGPEGAIALRHIPDSRALRCAIAHVLQADPRSHYRRTKCQDKLYFFNIDSAHVTVWFDGDQMAEVLRVQPADPAVIIPNE